jgi:alpha/beta superfamily hydrolase
MGGTMGDAVVLACARALIARGIAVLRFNFRGVGGSTGEFAGGIGCVPDVLGALDCLRGRDEIDRDRIFLGGYSLGAAMALKALPEAGQVCGYAAVALPFAGAPAEREEFASIEKVEAPLFVVIGETDQYGSAEAIRRYLREKHEESEVVVIPQADHFFRAPADALGRAADSLAGFVKARVDAKSGG